mmetsp:Transcript_11055/g.28043  ORF Transcript_11055/g.28043 Transcript_11055/m.28043 type:complete len:672 (+) Transcript_11055:64-2079(+)
MHTPSQTMNSIIDQPPSSLMSASFSSTNNFGMYYSVHRDYSENYYGYNGKDDLITPLVDKLYHEERIERCNSVGSNLHRQDFVDDTRRWSVGKISVFILLALSLADIFIHMVDAQIDSLEAHDHYDALSADVIRPAFRYHGDQSRSSRPSMGLGSAAISSVTTTLSPILPFTGGIDLRREDYWTNGVFGSFYSVVEKVRDAFEESPTTNDAVRDVLATPRGGAAVASKARPGHKTKSKKNTRSSSKEEFILSSPDSFMPLREIADSTLKDVTLSFRYTLESTRRDYNPSKFLSGVLPRVKKMMERMSTATTLARGTGVVAPITGDGRGTGDIDAMNFCATMRIFAEWRVLRQVPPGYKGYAVGIGLGQKDIVQNIAKIESAIHDYLDLRSNNDSFSSNGTNSRRVITSPTLRDLLQYEVDMDIHDNTKLPRLKEKSAAMGLLWVRRQLVYQTAIFNNVLDVPSRFDSSRAAVQAAYDEVYGNLHGWAVQKIFSYSFQAAPEGIEIYKYMNPHRLEEVQQEARTKILGMPVQKKRKSGVLGKLEHTPIGKFGRHIGNEWNKIACNVGNEWDKISDGVGHEWDKISGNVGQLFGQERHETEKQPRHLNDCAFQPDIEIESEDSKEHEVEAYIAQEMRHDAYEHIKAYLEVVDPLLDDLTNLIDEFNMDDPTKV